MSTPLPSLREYRPFYSECKTAADFDDAISDVLSGKSTVDRQALGRVLASHTYASRTAKMLTLINDHGTK